MKGKGEKIRRGEGMKRCQKKKKKQINPFFADFRNLMGQRKSVGTASSLASDPEQNDKAWGEHV
jgi:hypothetical protein